MPSKFKKAFDKKQSMLIYSRNERDISPTLAWGVGFSLFRIIAVPQEKVAMAEEVASALDKHLLKILSYIKTEGKEILEYFAIGATVRQFVSLLEKNDIAIEEQKKTSHLNTNSLISKDFKSEFLISVKNDIKKIEKNTLQPLYNAFEKLFHSIEDYIKDIPTTLNKYALEHLWQSFLNKNNKSENSQIFFIKSIEKSKVNAIFHEIELFSENITDFYHIKFFEEAELFINKVKNITNSDHPSFFKNSNIIFECTNLQFSIVNHLSIFENHIKKCNSDLLKLIESIENKNSNENQQEKVFISAIDFIISLVNEYNSTITDFGEVVYEEIQWTIPVSNDENNNNLNKLITNFESNFLKSDILKTIIEKADNIREDLKIFVKYFKNIIDFNNNNITWSISQTNFTTDTLSSLAPQNDLLVNKLSLLFQDDFVRINKKIETNIYQINKEFQIFLDSLNYDENSYSVKWNNTEKEYFRDLKHKIYLFENAIYEIENQLLFLIVNEFDPLFKHYSGLKHILDIDNQDTTLNQMTKFHKIVADYLDNILVNNKNNNQLRGFANLIDSLKPLKNQILDFENLSFQNDKKILIEIAQKYIHDELTLDFRQKWKSEFIDPYLVIIEKLNIKNILNTIEPTIANITTMLSSEILASTNPIISMFKYLNDRVIFYESHKPKILEIRNFFDVALIEIYQNANSNSHLLINNYQKINNNSLVLLSLFSSSLMQENFTNSLKITELKLNTRRFFQSLAQEQAIIKELVAQNLIFKNFLSANQYLLKITSEHKTFANLKLPLSDSETNELITIGRKIGIIIENIDKLLESLKIIIEKFNPVKIYLKERYPKIRSYVEQINSENSTIIDSRINSLINEDNNKSSILSSNKIFDNNHDNLNATNNFLTANWSYFNLTNLLLLAVGFTVYRKRSLFIKQLKFSPLSLLNSDNKEKNLYISEINTTIAVINNLVQNNAYLTTKTDLMNLINIKYFLLRCLENSKINNNYDIYMQPLLIASKKQAYSIIDIYQKNNNFIYQENQDLTVITTNEQEKLLSFSKASQEENYKNQQVETDFLLIKINNIKLALQMADEKRFLTLLLSLLNNKKCYKEISLLNINLSTNLRNEELSAFLVEKSDLYNVNSVNLKAFMAIENSYLLAEIKEMLEYENDLNSLEVTHDF